MLCLVARKESEQRNRNKNLVRWLLRRWSKQAKWYYHIKQHKNTGKMITSLSPPIFLVFPGNQTVQTRQQRNAKFSVHEKRITKRKAYRNVRVSREREREMEMTNLVWVLSSFSVSQWNVEWQVREEERKEFWIFIGRETTSRLL